MHPPNKPVIGITLGDYNGIGPEVILKALYNNQMNGFFTPVIYGSMRVMNRYKFLFELKDWHFHGTPSAEALNPKMVNLISCFDDSATTVEPGKITPEAGQAAVACLERAVTDLKAGLISAVVTAPIHKHNVQSEGFNFPGHTEFFAERFATPDVLMFMVSENLKIGVVTGHIPLGQVRNSLRPEAISKKLSLMLQSLKQDFGIRKPKIAVLGLNPHAGENGLLGKEDNDVISPVIEQFRKKNELVYGPFPADGFFGTASQKRFDAVLAMYHDQGLVPFKMLAFEDGVNFTAGLPIVRTSPDHGTAFDIAGKDIAEPSSFIQALYAAVDISLARTEHTTTATERAAREALRTPQERQHERREKQRPTGKFQPKQTKDDELAALED